MSQKKTISRFLTRLRDILLDIYGVRHEEFEGLLSSEFEYDFESNAKGDNPKSKYLHVLREFNAVGELNRVMKLAKSVSERTPDRTDIKTWIVDVERYLAGQPGDTLTTGESGQPTSRPLSILKIIAMVTSPLWILLFLGAILWIRLYVFPTTSQSALATAPTTGVSTLQTESNVLNVSDLTPVVQMAHQVIDANHPLINDLNKQEDEEFDPQKKHSVHFFCVETQGLQSATRPAKLYLTSPDSDAISGTAYVKTKVPGVGVSFTKITLSGHGTSECAADIPELRAGDTLVFLVCIRTETGRKIKDIARAVSLQPKRSK